ncbi:MAG TPA: hypothetical protein VGJ73_01395 [Verrucomicrobiae bacterium]|jgi:hypothetical protein
MKSKYIIVELKGMEVPLVFSSFLQHEDVALAIRNKVHSAGHCELNSAGKWIAGGESVSLKLDARQRDAEILNEHLGASCALGNCNGIPH